LDFSTKLDGWVGDRCDVAVCGTINCTHNGKCSGPDTCLCDGTGYAGETCDVDLDECEATQSPCDPIAIGGCSNSIGNYSCGACPAGYKGDGKIEHGGCVDINECEGGYCDPLVSCVNSVASFKCGQCPPGYSGSGYIDKGGCKGKGGLSTSSSSMTYPILFTFASAISSLILFCN
jgi:hypothetical protein